MLDSHHIQTIKFDLDIPSVSKNREIQNQVVKVFNYQFTAMLNEVFTTYGKNEDIYIESLTLELNPVVINEFEKNIIHQSREQLIKYFEKYKFKEKIVDADSTSKVNLTSRSSHPLLYYIFQGINSWQTTTQLSFTESWQKALKKQAFISQLKIAPWNINAIKRMVYQLNESLLHKTIQKILPAQLSDIKLFHDLLIELFNQKPFSKSIALFKQSIWIQTFYFLLIHNRNTFSKPDFVNAHLTQISSSYNFSLNELIDKLVTFVQKEKSKFKTNEYTQVLEEIQKKAPINPTPELTLGQQISIDAIRQLLFKKNRSNEDLDLLKDWILSPINKSAIQQFWINPLLEDALERVVFILVPKSSKFILQYHQELYMQQTINPIASSQQAFKRSIWAFTIDFLTSTFSSVFQAREFVLSHAKKMSNRYGIDYFVLIQTLLTSVRSLSENVVKYHGLLTILKSLASEDLKSKESDKHYNDLYTALDLNQVIEIIDNDSWLSHQDLHVIRQWLLDENNRKTIQKHWITTCKEKALYRMVDIVFPKKKSFVEQSFIAISNVFKVSSLIDSNSIKFKKTLYIILIDFLQANQAQFSKKSFVEYQMKTLLEHYNINYRLFIKHYVNFLRPPKKALKQLEYFSILNSLQNDIEKNAVLNNTDSFTDTINLSILCNYFETGKISTQHNSQVVLLSTQGLKTMHAAMQDLLFNNQEKLISFLLERDKPWQIHHTVLARISTSLVRNITVFETIYRKWLRLLTRIDTPAAFSISSHELAIAFYLEEGFFPEWISKYNQQLIRNRPFSNKTNAMLLIHEWSSKGIHNWVHNISMDKKKEVLKGWTNNVSKHALFRLYDNLFQVYNSIPSSDRPTTFLTFETSFWVVIFKVFKVNNSISSSNFTELFFKNWENEFKIRFINNTEIQELLKSSLFLPRTKFKAISKSESLDINDKREKTLISTKEDNRVPEDSLEQKTQELSKNLSKWHIANSGLILVHPFLLQLFKHLDYLNEENKFKNKNLLWRAVYLLHFIATGKNKNIDEVDLAISKILCGMRIKDSIPADLVLLKKEKDIVNELLSALITKWEKLGNTSIEGLRGTFLTRDGLLEYKDEAYQLTIETSGTDVLLDYIPWNINLVKLPWVKYIIYTSWR